MPRSSTVGSAYPADWPEIARQVKADAGGRCVRCNRHHDPENGYTLTVHHLDMNPANNAWWNLLPLCQRCHLSVQARVVIERPWVMTAHSEWFKPYAGGYFSWKYLGREASRDEVESNLDWFVDIERRAFGMVSENGETTGEMVK